jgi:hypothetical protein
MFKCGFEMYTYHENILEIFSTTELGVSPKIIIIGSFPKSPL